MTTRRTTGVPMLARPRRDVVELHVRRRNALADLVIFCIASGLTVLLGLEMGRAAVCWWCQ